MLHSLSNLLKQVTKRDVIDNFKYIHETTESQAFFQDKFS